MSLFAALTMGVLFLGGSTPPVQGSEFKPVPPAGWTVSPIEAGWMIRPDGLPEGKLFVAGFGKKEKRKGTLKEFFEATWTTAGPALQVTRTPEKIEDVLGGWKFLRGVAILKQDGRNFYLQVTALQKDEEQFSTVIMADSPETMIKYSPDADRTMGAMIGLKPIVGSPIAGAAFEATFPAGWEREDKPGFAMAHYRHHDFYGNDAYLMLLKPEPIQGSLHQTFERIWTREMKMGGIRLTNEGLLSPIIPQPLRRRLKNGLAVWYEGGEGTWAGFGSCYTQLFLVPTENTVTPVIAIYGLMNGASSTTDKDRAPVMQFLESFKPLAAAPKSPLFSSKDCVGHWELLLTGTMAGYYSTSGAYLGDASTGGLEDIRFHEDGTYDKIYASKSPTFAFAYTEKGTWTVDDFLLTLNPTSVTSPGKKQVQRYRIYGRAVFNGGQELLVSPVETNRLPTDALESGCTIEIATQGATLFHYRAKAD